MPPNENKIRARILVVDDHVEMVRLLEDRLNDAGLTRFGGQAIWMWLVAEVQWKWTSAFLAVSTTGSLMKPGAPKA